MVRNKTKHMKEAIDENLITKALEMHDAGKVNQEIISRLMPEGDSSELEEILDCLSWVETEGKSVSPSPLLLRTILAHIPHTEKAEKAEASVTKEPLLRYKGVREDNEKKSELAEKIKMYMHKKFFLPAGALALVVFLFVFLRTGSKSVAPTSPEAVQTAAKSIALLSAPVTIDEVFVSLDTEGDQDLSSLTTALESSSDDTSADQLLDTDPITTDNEI